MFLLLRKIERNDFIDVLAISTVQTLNTKCIARTDLFFDTYFHPELSTQEHVALKTINGP